MPRRRLLAALSSALLAMFVASTPASAAQQELVLTEEDVTEKRVYSPYAGRAYADRVFFGDMHFHTNLSFDAGLIGTTLDAHDGFRMARGEKVISNTGQPVQLIRPLDFLVITDHAEMIGLAPAIRESSPVLLAEPWGRWIHERFNAGPEGRMEAVRDVVDKGISRIGGGDSRYCITEVRAMTFSPSIFERCVRMSSWIPSTKNASSSSALRLASGSTAIDGRSSAAASDIRASAVRASAIGNSVAGTSTVA